MGRAATAAAAAGVVHLELELADLVRLAGLDLGLFCGPEPRALTGLAGLVDWRLNGALSHAHMRRLAGGRLGEVLLLPARGRLGGGRIFLFGLGPADGWHLPRLRASCLDAASRMREAGVTKAALGAPSCPERPEAEAAFVEVCCQLAPPPVALVASCLAAASGV